MPKQNYSIVTRVVVAVDTMVQAHSEEEARELAREHLHRDLITACGVGRYDAQDAQVARVFPILSVQIVDADGEPVEGG